MISEGSRMVDHNVLVLKEVDENIPPTQMDFTHLLFLVQVHDMPLVCMNREVGYRIGATLGVVEEVDVMGLGGDVVFELGSISI